jgi:hypothetical protein
MESNNSHTNLSYSSKQIPLLLDHLRVAIYTIGILLLPSFIIIRLQLCGIRIARAAAVELKTAHLLRNLEYSMVD